MIVKIIKLKNEKKIWWSIFDSKIFQIMNEREIFLIPYDSASY